MKQWICIFSGLFVAGSFSASAERLDIQTHTSSGEHDTYLVEYTYDDSGMSSDSGAADAGNDTHADHAYADMAVLKSSAPPPYFVEYDLGESHALTRLVIWNYNASTWWIQGIKKATIEVREFGGDSEQVYDGNILFAPGKGADPTAPSLNIDLTGITARFVRITSGSAPYQSWWSTFRSDSNLDVALSEVRIYGDETGLGNAIKEACCFYSGDCSNLESTAACVDAGGTPQGEGTECFTTVCPLPTEACCFDDGTCSEMDPNNCTTGGGVPQGMSTTCSTTACLQPEACCFNDGTCSALLPEKCTAAGGVSGGIFSDCGFFVCPQLEACCFSDGTCSDLLPLLCVAEGGVSHGSGTACPTASCVPATEEVADNAVEIGIEDRLGFMYSLEHAGNLNESWDSPSAFLVGDGGQAVLIGNRDGPTAFYRYTSDENRRAESRGFIGDTGSGWDTTSAVSIEASDERTVGGSWAGQAVFAINGNGVVGEGTTSEHEIANAPGGGNYSNPADAGKATWPNHNNTADESDDTHWVAVLPANYGTNLHPAAAPDTTLSLLFTFDQVYTLDELHIYNAMGTHSPYSDKGIREAEVLVSTINSSDRGDWTSVAWNTEDGTVTRNPETVDPYSVDEVVKLDGIDGQYVLLSVLSNHGATWGTGAGEFRFYPVRDSLPEPSSIQTVSMGTLTGGMSFTSASGTVYELERALKMAPGIPVGNPSADNGWSTTDMVSIVGHSGERDVDGAPEDSRHIIHTIDGSGMTGDNGDLHNNGTSFGDEGMFATTAGGGANASEPNPGTDQASGSHWVTYDLGSEIMLDDIEIWNDNQQTWYIQGWKNLKIQGSTSNGTSTSDWTTIYEGELSPAPGAGAAPSSASLRGLALGGVPTRYVTIINTGLGSDASWAPQFDGSNAALAEVRFLEQGEGEPDVKNATFKGTGSFTSGDGGEQTLYDPQGWDPDTYWYRVVPVL